MKEKTLADFTDYVRINDGVQRLKAEEQEVISSLEQIEMEMSKPKPEIDGRGAWELALQNQSNQFESDGSSALREEFQRLESQLRFIREALTVGEQELDKARGQASLELCQQARPQFLAEIKVILECLKKISASNETLDNLRLQLEQQGVRTGSLAYAKFNIGGSWGDANGGRVTGHQRHIAENYPELAAAAGQDVMLKRKALVERERAFNQKEQQNENQFPIE